MLISPVTYQGGKQRLAIQIIETMAVPKAATFFDLCCGSGAVSLALVERGHDPTRICMVDQGPWGLFWESVGTGQFDMQRFREVAALLPDDPKAIKTVIERLHRETPAPSDVPYVFLLLQAAAIGGTAVSIENGRWKRGSGYRDFWLPTETSSRRSHVNPMMPMPETIITRVAEIVERMKGVGAACGDAALTRVGARAARGYDAFAYIDPQYEGTTGYPYSIDAVATAKAIGCPCWVSEGRALSEGAVCLSKGRSKGGITGERKKAANEEWLSPFSMDGNDG